MSRGILPVSGVGIYLFGDFTLLLSFSLFFFVDLVLIKRRKRLSKGEKISIVTYVSFQDF